MITWVDLNGDSPSTATTYKIDSEWSASGLLIVDGNRNTSTEDIPALEITGNWTFHGMIWVIGKMKIAGTPGITGGVFAESSVDVDSTLTGNATLNFSSTNVAGALQILTGSSTAELISWQEL